MFDAAEGPFIHNFSTTVEPNDRVLSIIEKIIDQQGRLIEMYSMIVEELSHPPVYMNFNRDGGGEQGAEDDEQEAPR